MTAYVADLSAPTKFLLAAAVGGAGALGVVVGWNLAERKYHTLADNEIAEFKEQYHNVSRRIAAENEVAKTKLMTYVEEDIKKTQELYEPTEVLENSASDEVEQQISMRVFPEDPAAEWDQAAQILQREQNGPDEPYIIHQDEYMEGLEGQTQMTLTYYEEDEVLADIKDEAVPDQDELLGDGNLEFGYGSGDPNIVYIRNEKRELDFEIIRSSGSYAQEVHGIMPIKHSQDRRRARKMRDE